MDLSGNILGFVLKYIQTLSRSRIVVLVAGMSFLLRVRAEGSFTAALRFFLAPLTKLKLTRESPSNSSLPSQTPSANGIENHPRQTHSAISARAAREDGGSDENSDARSHIKPANRVSNFPGQANSPILTGVVNEDGGHYDSSKASVRYGHIPIHSHAQRGIAPHFPQSKYLPKPRPGNNRKSPRVSFLDCRPEPDLTDSEMEKISSKPSLLSSRLPTDGMESPTEHQHSPPSSSAIRDEPEVISTKPVVSACIHRDALHYNTSQHNTTHHNTSQHITTHHNTTHHNTSHHNTSQHITSQHITSHYITLQHKTSRRSFFRQ